MPGAQGPRQRTLALVRVFDCILWHAHYEPAEGQGLERPGLLTKALHMVPTPALQSAWPPAEASREAGCRLCYFCH